MHFLEYVFFPISILCGALLTVVLCIPYLLLCAVRGIILLLDKLKGRS